MTKELDKNENTDAKKYLETLSSTLTEESFSSEALKHMVNTVEERSTNKYEHNESDVTLADTISDQASGSVSKTNYDEKPEIRTRGLGSYNGVVDNVNECSDDRYRIKELLGRGGMGQVFSAKDLNFQRDVAIKFLNQNDAEDGKKMARFIREARITAKLEHPNILPIHDLDYSDNGQIFFTMRKVRGQSLGDIILMAKENKEEVGNPHVVYERINIIMKVCNAVSYAHYHGVLHQDIKPENIMLGNFGEVVLVDWGTAVTKEEVGTGTGKLQGTPLFMSPEQARRERVDERSDIYCIGASLYNALTLRYPTWSESPQVFWEKKKKGVIDDLPESLRKNIPDQLMAIIKKAMAPKRSDRYNRVEELIDDLELFQEGLAVSAYRDNIWELVIRIYRRNTLTIWISLLAVILVVFGSTLFYFEKQKETTSWVKYVAEEFENPRLNLSEHWDSIMCKSYNQTEEVDMFAEGNGWEVLNGAMYGRNYDADGPSNLTYKERIPGDMRVEWECTPLKSSMNVNCFLAAKNRRSGYTFHFGGWGNPRYFVLSKGQNYEVLAYKMREPLQVGRKYNFRMEKENDWIRFWINGENLFSVRDLEVLNGLGHRSFGFEVRENEIKIDNLKIFYQPLPRKISPFAVANSYFTEQMYDKALVRYKDMLNSYTEDQFPAYALYRMACCYTKMGKHEEALKLYTQFSTQFADHDLVPQVYFEQLKIYVDNKQWEEADEVITSLVSGWEGHPIFQRVYTYLVENLTSSPEVNGQLFAFNTLPEGVRRRVEEWGNYFNVDIAEKNKAISMAANFILNINRPDLIVKQYSDQKYYLAKAYFTMGQPEKVLQIAGNNHSLFIEASMLLGHFQEIIDKYPINQEAVVDSYIAMGKLDKAMAAVSYDQNLKAKVLFYQGKYDEIQENDNGWLVKAMFAMGKYDEIIEMSESMSLNRYEALLKTKQFEELSKFTRNNTLVRTNSMQMLDKYIKTGVLEVPEMLPDNTDHMAVFCSFILPAMIKRIENNEKGDILNTIDKYRLSYRGRLWYDGGYLLGKIDDKEFLNQPLVNNLKFLNSRYIFMKALKADWNGKPAEALKYYIQVKEIPFHEKEIDYIRDEFIDWRIRNISTSK